MSNVTEKVLKASWSIKRSPTRKDGEYDYAIIAEIDGEKFMVAEVFGRIDTDLRPDAGVIAARIADCVWAFNDVEETPREFLESLSSQLDILKERILTQELEGEV